LESPIYAALFDIPRDLDGDFVMHYANYKTILSPQNGMNLYRGCTHGCIYCDSRSACYQINHDFEDIEVKREAPYILESQLRRRRKPCVIGTGAMCDPYIPLEDQLQITRQCLALIAKYRFGLTVLTKSTRILRDFDILKAINAKTKCVTQVTLTTYNEDLCRKLEPNVSTTIERFHILEAMRDAGIPTVVWISPILPFINDTEENLRGLLDYCITAGVRGVMCFGAGVTMRDGNREYFYSCLDKLFPGMKERYIRRFGSKYVCNSPNNARLMDILRETCEHYGILWKPETVFAYLRDFESKERQISLF
jgi:DNA repair photolyase